MNFKDLEKMRDLHRIQFLAAAAAALYWPWYFIFSAFSSHLQDDLLGRVFISVFSGLVFIYSKSSRASAKRLRVYFDIGVITVLLHYTFLLANNDWDLNYKNAYIALIAILATSATRMKDYIAFAAIACILPVLVSPFAPPNSWASFLIFSLSNIAVLVFIGITMARNFRYKNELIHSAESSTKTGKLIALGQLASGMAHEINNPLAVIKGRSDQILMRAISDTPMDRDWLRSELSKIGVSVERIAKITRGLRSFARNSERDSFSEVTLQSWIKTTTDLCQERLVNNQVSIEIADSPTVKVLGRESQLVQVLLNLLNNSIDALAHSSKKNIKIDFEVIDNKLKLFVSDSGPGIPEAVQHKLKEPFYSTKMISNGFGLGLSISRGIMENHSGSLTYISKSNKTCFCIEIPLVIADVKTEQKVA